MSLELSIGGAAILFATGSAAGFVDSVAGGGGLITVPVLMNLTGNPLLALGTNKLQASFGSGSATFHHLRKGTTTWAACRRGFFLTVIGSVFGALAVSHIDQSILKKLIPLMLLLVAGYVLFQPKFGQGETTPKLTPLRYELIFCLGIGFYDGFFGPGTGTFFALTYCVFLGFNLVRATAHTKVMNFGSNLATVVFFALTGKVWLVAGLVMGVGQWVGAWLGSHLVVTKGSKFIRPVFVTMVLAITAKLLISGSWKTH